MTTRLGFLGAGNMAAAMAEGFVKSGLADGKDTLFYDVLKDKAAELASRVGGKAARSIRELMQNCETIILAVKPQNARELLPDVAPWAGPKHLFISILAGVPTSSLEPQIGGEPRVIRVMPNTPALVGAGASALARGRFATPQDQELAIELFQALGVAVAVEETQLDAVTAISGSGPAYFFYMMESLINAAQGLGLDLETARDLVLQTAYGAGKLAIESADPPATLRQKVTSKGGTTEAGLRALSEGNFETLVRQCAEAAAARSAELAKLA